MNDEERQAQSVAHFDESGALRTVPADTTPQVTPSPPEVRQKELTATLGRWPLRPEETDWAKHMLQRVDEYVGTTRSGRKRQLKQGAVT